MTNKTKNCYESSVYYQLEEDDLLNNISENEKNYYTLKFGLANKNNNKDKELTEFKNKFRNGKEYKIGDFEKAKKYLEIYQPPKELKANINKSIPYSFRIWVKFKLKQPYFSRDDEEFYLIQNPVLKEKVFKVPMIRGSGWKGALANAGRELIKENDKKGENIFWDYVFSYLRIFGTGNEKFRELMDVLNKNNKDNDKVELKKSLANYVLFNIRAQINLKDLDENPETLVKKYFNGFENKVSADNNKKYYEAKKGRAIFYPTYFDRLSLEVINPHSRKTKAGTQPIYFEVVPKGTEGILRIVYIPFDGILKENEELKKEVENDLEFLINCIEKVADLGVGAKTKLGWGTFGIEKRSYYSSVDLEINDKLTEKGWENANKY